MGSGYDAIVLAGGTSRRPPGVDKADLDLGGATLLERAVESVASAERVIVVADPRPLPRRSSGPVSSPPAPALGGREAIANTAAWGRNCT